MNTLRNQTSLLVGCLAGLLFAAGCHKSPPPAMPPPSCDCTGHVCGKVCDKICGVCPDDGVCSVDGTSCRAALPIGSPCMQDLDCGEGRVCITTATVNAPGGYCSKPCGGSATCPDGSVCEIGTNGESVCLASCSMSTDCRTSEGYQCDVAQGFCPACVGKCAGKTCGDDGCGHQCGQTPATPFLPVCNDDDQVCSGGQCAVAFSNVGSLNDPSGAYPFANGLWDAAAFQFQNGEIMLVGGREVVPMYPNGSRGSRGLDTVVQIDPVSRKIANILPSMPHPVARPQAAIVNNVVYVAGGLTDPDMAPPPDTMLDADDTPMTVFMAQNGAHPWKSSDQNTLKPMPKPSTGSALVALNNLLYLIAGVTDGAPSTRVDVYDPSVDEWSTPPSLQRTLARTQFAAVSDGLRIYVIGGWGRANALATVEIFDPNSGWTKALDLPQPVVDARAVVANGKIYVFGGRLGPIQTADEVADIQTIDLTTHQTAVIGRTDHLTSGQAPVVLPDGTVLLFGGLLLDGTNQPVADYDVLKFNVPVP